MQQISERKEELIRNINEMKTGSFEQMLLIIKYSLNSYFKSMQTFGKDNRVTKDNLNIIKEMFLIIRRERKLLNFILDNIDKFSIEASEDAVGMLDELNDKTIEYYYDLINDIEDASETGQEFRGYRPKRELKTLITDDSFLAEVFALGMSINDLKDFLSYEEEFWEYIKDKLKVVDTSYDIMSKMVRVTPITDDAKIVDMEILMPKISDIYSLSLALDILEKAHEIYKLLGNSIDDYTTSDEESINSKNLKQYISEKAKKYFKIKNVN